MGSCHLSGFPSIYFHCPSHRDRQHCGELIDPLRERQVCGLKAKASCFEDFKMGPDFPSLSVVVETQIMWLKSP